MTITMREPVRIPIGKLREAPWNANAVPKTTIEKIRRSLKLFGVVENNVVRPDWTVGLRSMDEVERRRTALMDEEASWFEVLSGNHRLKIYREEDVSEVSAVVVELPDPQAKMLAQVLNRTRGVNDKQDKLAELLRDILADLPASEVASFLPQSEVILGRLLAGANGGGEGEEGLELRAGPADSKPGTIYQLGPHRFLCGDATNREAVDELLEGEVPILMVTDPPYGVELDQGWRDRLKCMNRLAPAQSDKIVGDEGVAWVPALGLVKCLLAYVWHASAFSSVVEDHLEAAGYVTRQQIIWNKPVHALSRQHYQWKHEPCWYAVRVGCKKTPWYGGRSQTTVWEAASPKQIMSGSAEDKEDHPTQKPLLLFETPILNHLAVGEACYDPFVGSGTAIIAAAKTGRRCFAAELQPKYADLVRRRWTKWAAAQGVDVGTGALE